MTTCPVTARLPAIAALLCLTASGCAVTTPGTAMPAAAPPSTTAETLPGLMLPAVDVGAALSGTGTAGADVVVTRDVSAPWDDSAHLTESLGCLALAGAAQRAVYADSGWTALHGQVLREPPTATWAHFATQAVVLFPNAEAAGDFFARSRQSWASCADREMTYPQQLVGDQVWSIGPVTADRDMLAVSRTQRGPERWSCQRALTVHGNTAVDVEACDLDGPTSAATVIARAIADRLPST
jgi:hypothetical protein